MWLDGLIDRLSGRISGLGDRISGRDRAGDAEAAARVQEVIDRRGLFDGDRAFLDALLAAMPAGDPLAAVSLARVAQALRVRPQELDLDAAAEIAFWQRLAERFPDHGGVRACLSSALVDDQQQQPALAAALDAVERDPSLVAELADEVTSLAARAGGHASLRLEIAELIARLDEPDDADDIRERYSELLEDHRGDGPATARIRQLGARINQLTAAGKLPRAFVRRTRS